MLICPGCKSVLRQVPASGLCPKCGQAVRDMGLQTEGPHAATMDVTHEFAPPASGPTDKGDTAQPPATLELPPGPAGRSLSIAPRKLSAKNIALITNTWQGAVSKDSNQQSSLKIDSKSGGGGGGSSLVVNLRGVRSAEETVRPTTGADYELLQVIGKGGMGVVYSARQASVDRMVAVKMIRPTVAADAERREKFLSEAVVTGDLDHPNIVPIYELGTDEHDALFYSMKRVQGTPWSQVLSQKPLAENLEVLMKVADAVAFAHANGVVHRDLKPENVMLGDFGEVLVMDWGLALATASFRHAEFVTRPDSMGGTPAYMAPEMVTGPFELIGPTCDIYLLGALLFEVATGLRPHTGKSTQECLLAAARNEIQPTERSDELVQIAYRAMSTEPANRYASVQEFQAAIRDYQSHMESISLATRADGELVQARQTGDYQGFAHALFGFQEALALWEGNVRARAGIAEAQLAYAASARKKGDYDLGSSLLNADNPDHAPLRAELEAAQRERDARQKWLSRFKRIAAALVAVVFGVISVALFFIAQAKNQETVAKQQAFLDRDAAVKAEQAAGLARAEEEKQKLKAIEAEKRARQEELAARQAQEEERRQKVIAKEAEKTAQIERQKALLAKQGEEQAAYVARVGMATAKIDENAFDTAESLLAACQPESLRHWEWGYLNRLCGQGTNFPASGTVSAVAFSPDGSWFVTAGQDKRVHVWDRATGKERRAIDHPEAIDAVAVSHDGRLLATGAGDGVVRIFRVEDAKCVHELKGHRDRVLCVAFSPRDSRWLLSSSRDHTARVWDAAAGREMSGSPMQGHYGWVWSASFSADQKRIVTAGQDGRVIVWSFEPKPSGSEQPAIGPQKVFAGHQGPVFSAAFSPDGRQIASGGYDKRVLVWRPDAVDSVNLTQLVAITDSIAPQNSRALEGHTAPVRSIAFSPDGQYVLSGSDDNTVRIWDVVTSRPHAHLRGHSRPVLSCAISLDGEHVLSGGQDGQIKLWNLVNYKEAPHGRVLAGHDDAILAASFSRDARRIVTASRDHTARVYDADSGKSASWLREGHEFLASRALFFADGRRLLTAGGDNTARIWDAASGSQLQALEGTGRTAAMVVSRNGKRILTGRFVRAGAGQGTPGETQQILEASPQLALWDLDEKQNTAQSHAFSDQSFGKGHAAIVTAVAISPDGRWLFSADDAGLGKLWDATTGAESKILKGHTGGITAAVFLPDSTRLLTSSKDGTVATWEVASGRELPRAIALGASETRDAYDTPVTAMALSSDGRQVVTLSEETKDGVRHCIVRSWNVAGGTALREYYRGTDGLTSVAFNDDGSSLLAAGSPTLPDDAKAEAGGGFVRRWDVKSGREVTSPGGRPFLDLTASREAIWSAIEAPGGAGLLTVGGNGAALWNMDHLDKPELLFRPHSGVTAAGFSADGKRVVTGSSDRRVKIWNAETGLAEMQLPLAHEAAIASAGFSPADERLLLTASGDGTAMLWDLTTRKVLRTLEHRQQGAAAGSLRTAIFSPDSKSVLTAGDDATMRIWSAASGELLDAVKASAPVHSAAYSPDGKYILAGFGNGQAIIFDAHSHRALVQFSGHTDAIHSVGFSPDGRRAISGSRDRLVKVWDTGTLGEAAADEHKNGADAGAKAGKELLTLRYHDQAVTAVGFSSDGRSVLSASLDGTAVLWLSDAWQPARGE